jgi:hypothetical protein
VLVGSLKTQRENLPVSSIGGRASKAYAVVSMSTSRHALAKPLNVDPDFVPGSAEDLDHWDVEALLDAIFSCLAPKSPTKGSYTCYGS